MTKNIKERLGEKGAPHTCASLPRAPLQRLIATRPHLRLPATRPTPTPPCHAPHASASLPRASEPRLTATRPTPAPPCHAPHTHASRPRAPHPRLPATLPKHAPPCHTPHTRASLPRAPRPHLPAARPTPAPPTPQSVAHNCKGIQPASCHAGFPRNVSTTRKKTRIWRLRYDMLQQ
jgi:hypothetical protein